MQKFLERFFLLLVCVLAFLFLIWYNSSITAADFAINWTAAHTLIKHQSLYDWQNMSLIGYQLLGIEKMFYGGIYTQYIGPPATALIHLPFIAFNFDFALLLYRLLLISLFLISIGITGLSLPKEDRTRGWVIGILALCTWNTTFVSLQLGQVDGFIAFGLAIAIYGVSKSNTWLIGIGLGLSTILKLSPVWIIIYCVVRGKWQVVIASAFLATCLLSISAIIGNHSDLQIFLFTILPVLSQGSSNAQNQSLPALLAQIISTNFVTTHDFFGSQVL